MKLHLPKSLFIAVLAATGAMTTAWGKGDIIKYTVGDTENFHEGTFYNETTKQSDRWEKFCSDNGSYNGGDTLKLSGAGATLKYTFSPLSYNALIVEEGATDYVINPSADGRPLRIGRDGESHTSTINESVSVSSGTNAITTISGTQQTWLVKEGKQYTIGGGNVTNNSVLTIGGEGYNGTVSFSDKTITGSGSILVSNGTLADAVFGSGGTLAVNGATKASSYSNVSMSAGSIIDLSSATLSADTALVDTDHLNIADGVHVKLNNVSTGDTLALFDSVVDVAVFYINGAKVVEAHSDISQENGVFTFNSLVGNLADMVWAGGASGTWNSTAESWQSASVSGNQAFANGDTVSFNSSATVDIAESVTVGGLTINGDKTEVKFTRSNSGYVAGNVEVTGGAKLIIATETEGQGLVQGNITVTNGTLQFDAKDVTGYNGGVTSTQKITIASGSSLYLNHDSNETFAGTLVLNGTLSGKSASSKWDFFGTKAKVQVDSGNHGSISAHTRVRGNMSVEVGENASLTLAKVTSAVEAGGTGVLTKSGAGQLIFAGNATAGLAAIRSADGSIKVGNSSTDTSSLTVTRIELGSNNTGSGDILYVSEGSLLKITGNINQDTNRKSASIILGEWNVSTTVNLDGTMLAKDAYVLPGITGGVININGTGTLAAAGISKNAGGAASKKINVTLNDGGKLILGSGGIDASLESDSITLKNGIVATYADSMTIAKAVTLSGTTGTIFDTEKYAFADDGNSISKIAPATPATITVSGVISGGGKLIKDGQGDLVLSAQNTYTGGTSIKQGRIQITSGAELGSGGVEIQQNGVLEIHTQGNSSIDGNVTLKDGGTMIVKNGYWKDQQANVDILVENSGRIESGWGGNNGSVGGSISGAGTLELACPVWEDSYSTNAWKLNATVSDKSASEKLAVISNTNVTMGGDNSYSGGTVIQGYTLTTNHANALGSGEVSLEGGTLKLEQALSAKSLTYTSGIVDLNGKTLTVAETVSNSAENTENLKLKGGTGSTLSVTGNLQLGGALDLENGTDVTVVLNGSDNRVKIIDFSQGDADGDNAKGVLKLVGNGTTLTTSENKVGATSGSVWMSSTSSILLDEGAKLVSCNATVTGRDLAQSTVSLASGNKGNVTVWSFGKYEDVDVEVTASSNNGSMTSQLLNSSVKNSSGSNITLTHESNRLSGVHAATGNINLQNVALHNLTSFTIADALTVGAHTGSDGIDAEQNLATIKVGTAETKGTASFGKGAKLYANLSLSSGSEVTVSGALTMGSGTAPASEGDAVSTGYTLSLEKGITLKLKDDLLTQIGNLTASSEPLVLITGVNTLQLGDQTYTVGSQVLTDAKSVSLSDYITIEGFEQYYVSFNSEGSVIAGLSVPEPTTTTLGLLALAGLCARRRRK